MVQTGADWSAGNGCAFFGETEVFAFVLYTGIFGDSKVADVHFIDNCIF